MLDVIYEDNHVLVVIKPQNVPCQEDESKDLDLLTMCKQYLKEKYNKPGNVFCGLVHRLDRTTGGVMVFAKTSKCASRLSEQIRNDEMEKRYLTVTENIPVIKQDYLVNYLKKDPIKNIVNVVPMLTTDAKKAELKYSVLETIDNLALIDVELLTGRSHQIRVQLKNIKCPIYGDNKYNLEGKKSKYMALWAYKLSFKHPVSDKILNFVVYPPVEEEPWNKFDIAKLLK